MVKSKASKKNSSDREKWKKIFNSMVILLKNQQTQIGCLVTDRKLLEDRIKLQHERWKSDVNLFQDQISQIKRDFALQEMERMVESAKADMLIGLKQREAVVYKKKFESVDSDLADFRECFDCLTHQCSSEKDVSTSANNAVQSELMRLKCEYDKLRVDKDREISALLSEKRFVWNQYNTMERDLNEQLKIRQGEAKSANDKIQRLLVRMEELQSSNTVKDATIATLRTDIVKLESESGKQNEEISRLSKEVEILRKTTKDSTTPLLRRCATRSGNSQVNGKICIGVGRTVTPKEELDSSHGCEKKARRSSRRKAVEVIDISEDTPKLFTSAFRVPKLKNPSPSAK